ncbi:MAG: hypothetical protein ACRCSN_09670 [Dermatophilaceae bacterium]
MRGEVMLDPRGGGRALRVSWHPDDDVVVLSIWRGPLCTATFQLDRDEVPVLVDALVRGLIARPGDLPSSGHAVAG